MSQAIQLEQANAVPNQPSERLTKLGGVALTLLASLGTFGMYAVQGIILARLLGPEQRGAMAAAMLFPQSLVYLGMLGAPELFAGYAARGLTDAPLRRSAARYGLLAGLISMVLCVALDWLTIPLQMRAVLWLAMICSVTLPLQQIRLSVLAVDHGQRAMKRYNLSRMLSAAAFPIALGLGVSLNLCDLKWCCFWFVISQTVALLLSNWGMSDSWIGPAAVPVKSALKDARGLMLAWFATETMERLDLLLMMVLIANEEVLGFYAAAAPIAAAMIIIPNAIGLYAFNRGARENEIPSSRDAWYYLAAGLAIQLVCGAIFAALLPWLVHVLYGTEFDETVKFAWLLLPAGALRGLLQAADSFLRARNKPYLGIQARLISIPLLIAIAIFGRQWWGPYAIPIGLSVAQLVCFAFVAWAVLSDVYGHANKRVVHDA